MPQQRVQDYVTFLNPNIKSPKLVNGKSNDLKKSEKEMRFKFSPYELYYEKHKSEFADQRSLFFAKGKARTAFLNLNDKKKIKFIKKIEEKYDSYSVSLFKIFKYLYYVSINYNIIIII